VATVGVLIIHGMGDPDPSFADGLILRLRKRLEPLAASVDFEPCYWAPILQEQQDRTWERMLRSGEMDAKALRRWVMGALGDPATYLSGYFKSGQPAYGDIHESLRASLAALESRLTAAAPLVVLAHSLGSVIVSNYIWDEQQNRPSVGRSSFERMETLTGFVTYGSNIPLFLPPHRPAVCIRFPHPSLPADLAAVAAWENIYDPDDIIGYPLSQIWDDPQGTQITDVTINVGTWPVSETPFSHTLYNKDDDFLGIVERRLRAILAAAA